MSIITRHNLCPNPSIETSTSGWTTQGTHPPSAIAQTSTQFWPGAGSKSLKVTFAAGAPSEFNGVFINCTTTNTVTYTASAWVKVPTGSTKLTWWVSGGAGGDTTTLFDQWQRLFYTFTATGSTTGIQLLATSNATAGGEIVYIDAIMLEQTSDHTLPYFDGDSVGASWDGTAELSTSTFTAFDTSPSAPLTVIEFDALGVQATDFVIGQSQLDGNLLVGNSATFDTTVGNWVNSTNTTPTFQGAQGHTAVGALQMSSIAAGDMEVKSCADGSIASQAGAVIGGESVQVSAWVKASTVGRTCRTEVQWYDSTPTQIGSTVNGTGVADVTTGFTQLNDAYAAPSNAAFVRVLVRVLATAGAAEIHYVDDVSVTNNGAKVLVNNPRYVSVSGLGDVVTSVDISRGRSDPNGDIQPGSATLGVDNFIGSFDPENTASHYNLDPGRKLRKGMRCRISAIYALGGAYSAQTLFVGKLDNLGLREGLMPDATLSFIDDLAVMGATNMPMFDNSVRSGEATLSRATWLYYGVGQLETYFSVGLNASFSAGLQRQLVPTYGGGSVLDELSDIAAAEAGRSFVDRTGVFTILAHSDLIAENPIATLTDNVAVTGIEYADVKASSGTLQVVNICRAHPYSQPSPYYPDQTYIDSDSVSKFGPQHYNGAVGYKAALINSGDLAAIAKYVATRYSHPIKRYDAVTTDFNGNPNATPLLGAEIGQQVTVSRTMPYVDTSAPYTITCLIEGIQYNINDQGEFLQTLITSPTDSASLFGGASIFIVGSSLIGGSDVLSSF